MELIDFHTHIFPNPIANRAAQNVGSYYGLPIEGDGTAAMLKAHAPQGVKTRFVVSSAAMKAKNVIPGNDFLIQSAAEDSAFIPFASFHPDMGEKEALAELERVASLGVYGVKLHPDFQHIYIDEERLFPMYRKCAELKLPILFHVGDKGTDFSTPKRMRRVADMFPNLTVIAAHLGGYSVWGEAQKYLIGADVYMDCSESVPYISEEETYGMIKRHGVDRVMFGSDFPVFCTDTAFALIDKLPFTPEEKEKIYHGNAERLLGL